MLTISFLILTLSLGKGSFSEDETLKSLGDNKFFLSRNFLKASIEILLPATVPLMPYLANKIVPFICCLDKN